MLSPRLTNCVDCASIPSLLQDIDCKIASIAKDLYNNTIIMSAEWDNFTYFTNDNEFLIHIRKGTSEPYDGGYNSQLNIVKRYISK